MHKVSNSVEIPLDEIERILIARAVPDFTGSVEITVHILPSAGLEVQFEAVTENHLPIGRAEETAQPVVTNGRVNAVRYEINKIRDKFLLGTTVRGIRASFVKGELRSFKLCEAE
jgi:hypothetical protein